MTMCLVGRTLFLIPSGRAFPIESRQSKGVQPSKWSEEHLFCIFLVFNKITYRQSKGVPSAAVRQEDHPLFFKGA